MSLLYIFDMDDVLYSYDWRARMTGLSSITGLSFARLRELWWHEDGELAAEAGRFTTGEEYLAAFESAIGVTVGESEWVRVRGSAMTARPAALAAVRRAAELGDVTLLTNNGALTAKYLRVLAPELEAIFGDHLYTSSDYRARKPDPVVFQRVLDRYDREARDAFFVDDMSENVEGAASIGITAHLYRSEPEMLDAIERFARSRQ